MNKNKVYILEDRGLLYVSGDDVKEFLQNIITNDIYAVSEHNSCFAGLLSPQGKYLHDFIVVKHKSGYFLDCEKKIIDELYKQLTLYKLRSKVEILNLSNEFVIAALHKDKFLELENTKDQNGYTTKFREDTIFLDPRHTELGARLIINLEKLYLSLKKLNLQSSNVDEYYNLSHSLGIPQIDTKELQNKLFGIECNFEELKGIDFKKGCYVGQENTARMKLKNKIRRQLMSIKTGKSVKIGDEIKYNNNVIGKILIDKPYPFALIKLFDPEFSVFKNKTLKINNDNAEIIS